MMTSHRWVAVGVCAALLVATTAPSAAAAQSAQSNLKPMLLQASDVPGFSKVSAADETLTVPNDQGTDQAFISCAKGHKLIDQFDAGGADVLVGPFWGKGTNPFGTPVLSIASVVFGDGSPSDARTAEATLANIKFQRCWAATTDKLNAQQGITVPVYDSLVRQLPDPRIGANSAAFVVNSTYTALGRTAKFQTAVTVVQEGSFVVMLYAMAFNEAFPQTVIDNAAERVSPRMRASSPVQRRGTGFSFHPTFGEPFTGRVALLPGHPRAGTTVTVNWGDGAVTPAQLVSQGASTAVYQDHTYWVAGTVPVTVDVRTAGTTQILYGRAYVGSQYTAMGDSYSSGEGADWPPGNTAGTPGGGYWLYQDHSGYLYHGSTDYLSSDGTGDVCHRSITAYAHVVQRMLAVSGMTLHFVACSGAIVTDMYTAAKNDRGDKYLGEKAQLSALTPRTSLVTLTIGGNNAQFAPIAQACVEAYLLGGETASINAECVKQDARILSILGYNTNINSASDGVFTPGSAGVRGIQTTSAAGESLAYLHNWSSKQAGTNSQDGVNLHDAWVMLLRKIKALAPGARILVLGYPAFFQPQGPGTCIYFTHTEQLWVNSRIKLVDAVIQDAANESGVAQYVQTYDALAGHQECVDPLALIGNHPGVQYSVSRSGVVTGCSGQYINPIDVLGAAVRNIPENLHPNPCGHLAEGRIVVSAYDSGMPGAVNLTVDAGKSQVEDFDVPALIPGTSYPVDRANFTVQWSTPVSPGSFHVRLTDPVGFSYAPVQQGPVYSTWDILDPVPGEWRLTLVDTAAKDSGSVNVEAWRTLPVTVPRMPPAGVVHVTSSTSFLTVCAVVCVNKTLDHFAVSSPDPAAVDGYRWYSDSGTLISTGDTAQMTSQIGQFKIILEAFQADGAYRFTVFQCTTKSCTEESPTA